jgi:hypothetical protein
VINKFDTSFLLSYTFVRHKHVFFLVLILITIIIVYAKLKYFTLSGPIPGKPPQFLWGNFVQTGLSSGRYLGEITKQFQDEYGDTFHLWIGLIHLCL